MPVYEFECDNCGYISEKFYRAIPRIDPISIRRECSNCKFDATHKKILSNSNFHLMPGKVSWGEGKFSSGAPSGDTPVEFNEPE